MNYKNGKKYDENMNKPEIKLWFEMIQHYLKQNLPPEGKVLDAGGGTGEFSIRIAKLNKNLHMTNCDISDKMLERAQEKVEELNLNNRINNIRGDIQNLPFSSNNFDFVLCLGDALSFCKDVNKGFSELVRVTKPEGLVYLSVNSFWASFFEMFRKGENRDFYFEDLLNYYETHDIHQNHTNRNCRSFTVNDLDDFAENYNLKILRMFATPIFPMFEEWLKDKSSREKILELQYKHCEDKKLINFGNHINVIFKK